MNKFSIIFKKIWKLKKYYRLLVNLFNACFNEPTPGKIGQVLFTRRVIKAPLITQAAPAESQPKYQNFQIFLKTIFLG